MKAGTKKILVSLIILALAAANFSSFTFASEESIEENIVDIEDAAAFYEEDTTDVIYDEINDDVYSEDEAIDEYTDVYDDTEFYEEIPVAEETVEDVLEEDDPYEEVDAFYEEEEDASYEQSLEEVREDEEVIDTVDPEVIVQDADEEIENLISEIQVSDITILEGNAYTEYYYDWATDEEYEYPYYYDIYPKEIEVTVSDGTVYSGYPGYVCYRMSEDLGLTVNYNIATDQSYQNQWGVGTHEATFTIGGFSAQYNVIIVANPITDVKVSDVSILEGNTYTEYYYDHESGEEYKYQRYEIYPEEIEVTVADGTVYSGYPYEVCNDMTEDLGLTFAYYTDSDQSYQNQWGTGTHKAVFKFGQNEAEFNVIIIENPIQEIIVPDLKLVEGDTYTERSWYGADISYEYAAYQITPSSLTVLTKDGSSYSGELYQVRQQLQSKYGINFNYRVVSDQSYQNPWGVGSHKATISLGYVSKEYTITIIANPIKSITVEDITVIEGNTVQDYYYDSNTGTGYFYDAYQIYPNTITVTMTDGKVYTDSLYYVSSNIMADYGINIDYRFESDQSQNPWGLGTHDATIIFGGVSSNYKVTVTECLIKEMIVQDVTRIEGDTTSRYYRLMDGTMQEYQGFYNEAPDVITVTTKDGKTYSGSLFEVSSSMLDDGYDIDYYTSSNQSNNNLWTVGTYEAQIYFGGKKATYNVEILENPFKSLTVTDKTISLDDYYEETYYDADGNEIKEKYYICYPDKVTLTKKDGTTISGTPYDVYQNVSADYSVVFYRILQNGKYFDTSNLQVGTYDLTFKIAGKTASYKLTVTEGSDVVYPDGFNYIRSSGKWVYYKDNKPMSNWTGVVNGTIDGTSGWYYVVNGVYDPTAKGITKRADGSNKTWYYVLNGKFTKKSGIAQRADGSNKTWYYVKNGVFTTKATGIAQRADGSNKTWYYVKNGVFTKATGITKRADGSNKTWYYVKNGVFTKATCIALKADGSSKLKYYVKNGTFNTYTGTVTISGKKYKLVKGVVK